jgi:hypothetical protein
MRGAPGLVILVLASVCFTAFVVDGSSVNRISSVVVDDSVSDTELDQVRRGRLF